MKIEPAIWTVGVFGGAMAQPKYQQIADDLRDQIKRGDLQPGAQLPSEFELRHKYQASRNTIKDAVKRLISLGLVETRPGQGTFVTAELDPLVTTLTGSPDHRLGGDEEIAYLSAVDRDHRTPRVSVPRVEVLTPSENVAARMRIKPGTQVVSRHQQRFIDGVPFSRQTSFYPIEFVTSGKAPELLLASDMPEGTLRYLEERTGLKQVGYRDWITARTPDQEEQAFFRIPHDATVFEIFRTGFDQNTEPLRVTVTVFPADRNQFLVNVGEVPGPRYETEA
jgi:GntR family transcriptional regulator